jgi:MFS transporter, DHA2 family, glioxin efflux transporter
MLDVLPTDAPGVNPLQLLATGATEVRATFPTDQLNGILSAYMSGIKGAFAVGIGGVGLAFVVSLLQRWDRLNREALKESGGAA